MKKRKNKRKTIILKKGSKMPTPEEIDEIFERSQKAIDKLQANVTEAERREIRKKYPIIERWEEDNIEDEFKSLLK